MLISESKIEVLASLVRGKVDIMLISESKIEVLASLLRGKVDIMLISESGHNVDIGKQNRGIS